MVQNLGRITLKFVVFLSPVVQLYGNTDGKTLGLASMTMLFQFLQLKILRLFLHKLKVLIVPLSSSI